VKAAAACVLLLWCAAAADASSSKAERFDATIRVLPGGDVEVAETLVLRFLSGSFDDVAREIPAAQTDGVEILEARMEGQRIPFGERTGEAEVSRGSRIRVRWHFDPVSDITRTFGLTYVLRGAVRQEDGADLLVWRVPAQSHAWRIDTVTLNFHLPDDVRASVALSQRSAGMVATRGERGHIEVSGNAIRANGWIEAALRVPEGHVIAAAPAWQERRRRADALAPGWGIAAALLIAAGTVVLFGLRQSYDAPPRDLAPDRLPTGVGAQPVPDALSATVAGALASNGRASLEQAMAALLMLADRGVVTFEQTSLGAFGVRSFAVGHRDGRAPLSRYEEEALAIVFKGDRTRRVSLVRARQRLTRHLRRFSAAVREELAAAGFIDDARRQLRQRYLIIALSLFGAALISVVPASVFLRDYAGWPLLVSGALGTVGATALLFHARITPLSNEGVRRSRRWRAFGRHLKAIAEHPAPVFGTPCTLLPYAVSLGAGSAWGRRLKRERLAAPGWFQAAGDEEAFAAFVTAAGTRTAHAH
jgi:hypothetical protein